jgi:hypothetical protein
MAVRRTVQEAVGILTFMAMVLTGAALNSGWMTVAMTHGGKWNG